MKKLFTLVMTAMMAMSLHAQDDFGSQKGGFAITFNANPVLNYVGNMFNGTQNNSLRDFNGLKNPMFSGTTITGKYMLEDNVALDLGFGFDNSYDVTNSYSDNDPEKSDGFSRKGDTDFMIKGGLQYLLKPGQRLQPTIGLDLVYAHRNNWIYTESDGHSNQYSGSPVNALGLMASAGVEYFIWKQVSVGATVDFAIAKTWNNKSAELGGIDFSRVETSNTIIKTGNLGGNLSLNFYF